MYAVGMLSPSVGDAGESAATFSGGIALDPALPTQAGKAVVSAANPTAAIQAALVNTVTVTFGGQSAGYEPDSQTVSTTPTAHLPFVVTSTSTAGQYVLHLEDLSLMPGATPDWDYNDRTWTVRVTELTTISITPPAPAEESADGVRPVVVELVRTNSMPGSLDQPLYLPFTLGGTATPGVDYTPPTSNIAVFWPGQMTTKIVMPVMNDGVAEGSETIIIGIDPPTGTAPGPIDGTIPIHDPGTLPPVPPSPPPATLPEVWVSGALDGEERADNLQPVVFQLSRSNPTPNETAPALTVGFSLSGVAAVGVDYTTPPSYTATFASGELTTWVTLSVVNDLIQEGSESVVLTVLPGGGYTVVAGADTGWANIYDPGTKPTVPPPPPSTAGVGDLVWFDRNGDGFQTPGETGAPGVTVQLLSNGLVLRQTFTNAWGRYWFADVPAGYYQVRFLNPNPAYYYFTTQFATPSNPSQDSDADGDGKSPVFQVTPGQTKPDVDAGLKAVKIQFYGDTNRDGNVTDADLKDCDKWTPTSGAIYAVNHDDSGNEPGPDAVDVRDGKPDAIQFKDDGTVVEMKDGRGKVVVENAEDAKQLAPLLVKNVVIPIGAKLIIRVDDVDQFTAIHLFPERKAGAESILGNVGTRQTGGVAPTDLFADITAQMKAANGADLTLGVEGLLYKYDGANAPAALKFRGSVMFTLELWGANNLPLPNGPAAAKVKMKVAPWMMMSNAQASKQVFAVKAESPARKPDNDALRAALDTTNQLVAYDPTLGPDGFGGFVVTNSWAQDHAEIGYTQQPGGDPIWATLQLPYSRNAGRVQPEWVKKELLKNKMGLFQLGETLGSGDGGDFGGNVELMPPDKKHPLGVIVVGDKISPALKQFFDSQEVQTVREVTQPTTAKVGEVLVLPTKWLVAGHVDEMLSFDKAAGKVVFADPEATYTLLKNKLTAAEQDAGLFFATGKTQAGAVNAEVVAAAENPDYRIETPNIDHTLPVATKFKYIRIVSGAAKGQIAEIVNWKKDYVEVGDVWNTTSNLVFDKKGRLGAVKKIYSEEVNDPAAKQAKKWFVRPKAGDKFILMDDSKLSKWGNPMAFSLREMLADPNFEAVNSAALVAGQIDLARKLIKSVSPTIEFVSVPTLYFGWWNDGKLGPDYVDYSYAFNPGLGNLQIVNGKYFVPQPFAPKYANGKDLFEEEVKDKLGAADVVFVDDWSFYHLSSGEIHCGTLVRREVLPVDWWVNLKATK